MNDTPPLTKPRLVLVTGPSGAGRSTAINVLEDIGFETIDNLPISLLSRVLDGPLEQSLAVGLDVRNRDFSVDLLLQTYRHVAGQGQFEADLLFVDCSLPVLARRYSETRRRHPLAGSGAAEAGIEEELHLLAGVRDAASRVIDTSDLSPHDLKHAIKSLFQPGAQPQMVISVQSFSYKRGTPQSADLALDCRFLRNPHWDPDLRPLDGRNARVVAYIDSDPNSNQFFNKLRDMMVLLLPAYAAEGKSYLTIAFGCTGGQHRSVAMAEKLSNWLANQGWQASTRHRELERRAQDTAPQVGERA